MGLTFNNPNNLQQMLDKFATVPDPKRRRKDQVKVLISLKRMVVKLQMSLMRRRNLK